jgi:hypothetical protein
VNGHLMQRLVNLAAKLLRRGEWAFVGIEFNKIGSWFLRPIRRKTQDVRLYQIEKTWPPHVSLLIEAALA